MTLGAKIRKFRAKSGLSQDNVAYRLGISQPTYGKIESDAKIPNFEEMLKISEILETNLKEFMPDGYNHLNIENNNGQANNGSLVQQTSSKIRDIGYLRANVKGSAYNNPAGKPEPAHGT